MFRFKGGLDFLLFMFCFHIFWHNVCIVLDFGFVIVSVVHCCFVVESLLLFLVFCLSICILVQGTPFRILDDAKQKSRSQQRCNEKKQTEPKYYKTIHKYNNQ